MCMGHDGGAASGLGPPGEGTRVDIMKPTEPDVVLMGRLRPAHDQLQDL